MIFAKTIDLLLSGRKTQTLRLAYVGEYFGWTKSDEAAVFAATVDPYRRRTRWIVGHTYAIQRERCALAEGYFRCTYLREVVDPTKVDEAFAWAEGFDSVADFLRVWHELHGRNPAQRCWAIGIGKVCRTRNEIEAWEVYKAETADDDAAADDLFFKLPAGSEVR